MAFSRRQLYLIVFSLSFLFFLLALSGAFFLFPNSIWEACTIHLTFFPTCYFHHRHHHLLAENCGYFISFLLWEAQLLFIKVLLKIQISYCTFFFSSHFQRFPFPRSVWYFTFTWGVMHGMGGRINSVYSKSFKSGYPVR